MTVAVQAARESREVGFRVSFPVHAAYGNDRVFRAEADSAGACIRLLHGHPPDEQGSQHAAQGKLNRDFPHHYFSFQPSCNERVG